MENELRPKMNTTPGIKKDFQPESNVLISLLDNAIEAILLLDTTGRLVYHNLSAKKISGYELSEIAGRYVWEFIHPMYAPTAQAFFGDPTVGPGEQKTMEFRILNRDGSSRWVECTITNNLHNPDVIGYIATYRDIMDRRESERNLRTAHGELDRLFNTVNEVLFSVDIKANKVTQMSPACEKLYGYSPEDFYQDRYLWQKVVHPEDSHIIQNHYQTLDRGLPVNDEYRIIHKDGSVRWFRSSVNPSLNSAGDLIRIDGVIADITERKRADEALLRSKANLKAIVQNTETAYLILDTNFRIVTFNEVAQALAQRFLYISLREGIDFLSQASKERQEPLLALFRSVMAGELLHTERSWTEPDGSIYWYYFNIHNISDANGQVQGLFVASTDITKRKKDEQELEAAHKELNRLFDTVHEVLYSVDFRNYKITQISASCREIYGFTEEEFKTQHDLWQNVIHPDDRFKAGEQITSLMMGQEVNNEYRIIHKNGSIRWLRNTIIPTLDKDRQLIRLDGLSTDITEKKKVEEELSRNLLMLREFFESAPEAIIIRDCDIGKAVDCNNKAMAMFGYQREELLNKMPSDLSPADQPDGRHSGEKAGEILQRAMAGEKIVAEWTHINASGIHMINEVRVTRLNIPGHNLLRTSIINIADKKRAEAEIIALNESLEKKVQKRTAELEEANKELEAFSYTVSHDLQSPLRAIQGFSDILKTEYYDQLDANARQYLTFIADGAQRMSLLTSELLAFSRFAKIPLLKEHTSMNQVVRFVTEEAKMVHSGLKTQVMIGDLPTAYCDPSLIKQVWTNLILNAFKYSKNHEQPMVEIGAEINEGRVTYYVRDNGVGFEMKYASKLFNVFKRLHSEPEFEGSGIGLALVQRIISRHGGKVWANAKVNGGAVFYFTLPKA